ncbi:Cof-type HAD-IIB family hydrolase [Spiroplasma endosymbiont of Crioceris asparagi]|uniref:Cof-type HAD-IIB family hydrolase n=1 Tax=Spiroplasma endosymbiont of Crioceris asparagi TaxID=3066286 RepID=UPI0030D4D933
MKWWISDYDGTININEDEKVLKEDLDFINEWINNGNKFVIASGRIKDEILHFKKYNKIDFDYIIANNGACVYDKHEQLIATINISMESRPKIKEVLTKLKDEFSIGYTITNIRNSLAYTFDKEIDGNDFFNDVAPKFDNWESGIKDIENNEMLNDIMFLASADRIDKVREYFKDIPDVKCVKTHKNLIEVIHKDVSKAHGINMILQHANANVSMDDIYTSGDGENDIEMLAITKNSFAMEKASDNVKKHAQHVIKFVREIKNYL